MELTAGELFLYGGITGSIVLTLVTSALILLYRRHKKRLMKKLRDEFE